MKLKEIALPALEKMQFIRYGRWVYGASQQAYPRRRQRRQGSGAVTLANQCLYLASTDSKASPLFPYPELTHDNLLGLSETLWEIVNPGFVGTVEAEEFAAAGARYGASTGVSLSPHRWDLSGEADTAHRGDLAQWLEEQLVGGRPVAFLAKDPGLEETLRAYHWAMIVKMRYNDRKLFVTLYDDSREKTIDVARWLDTTTQGASMVSFSLDSLKSEAKEKQMPKED